MTNYLKFNDPKTAEFETRIKVNYCCSTRNNKQALQRTNQSERIECVNTSQSQKLLRTHSDSRTISDGQEHI